MKNVKNGGIRSDHVVQNRFTAYLTISLAHHKAKYLADIAKRQQEISFEANEKWFDTIYIGQEDIYFQNTIDGHLGQALQTLIKRDKEILLRRAVVGESFVRIAAELGISYAAAKAAYRRSVEKIRKEMEK